MKDQELARAQAQEQAERVVQRLMWRYTADTRSPAPASAQDPAFRHWLGLASGMLSADLSRASPEQADTRLIPVDAGRQRLCLALRTSDHVTALVLADPFDREHRLWIESRLRAEGHPRTRWYVAPVQAVLAMLDRIEQARRDHEARRIGVRSPRQGDLPHEDNGTIDRINALLRRAIEARASQVHLLGPRGPGGRPEVRLRIDGRLHRLDDGDLADAALGEDLPAAGCTVIDYLHSDVLRDGILPIVHGGRALGVRVALHGDEGSPNRAAVLHLPRLPGASPRSLDALGLPEPLTSALREALAGREGLWLVVSPPGGGRSTTLAALAAEADAAGQRALLLHAPDAAALETALAQDPDRLFIDDPGAALADHDALADVVLGGRSVVLTCAAAGLWSALERLRRLGLTPSRLGACLDGVLLQALVRRDGRAGGPGRQVVASWLPVDAAMADLIAREASPASLRQAAQARGGDLHRALHEEVEAGIVTREEADRVAALAR